MGKKMELPYDKTNDGIIELIVGTAKIWLPSLTHYKTITGSNRKKISNDIYKMREGKLKPSIVLNRFIKALKSDVALGDIPNEMKRQIEIKLNIYYGGNKIS